VANVNFVPSTVDGDSTTGVAADPAALLANVKIKVTSGELTAGSPTDAFISSTMAKDRHLAVGSQLTADIGSLKNQQLTVRGVFEDNQVINNPRVIYTPQLYAKAVPSALQGDFALYVKARDGADASALRSQLVQTVKPFVVVSVEDAKEYTNSQADQINIVLSLLYALLALSVVIAVLGIINTLALSVFERTREIGLLRAVGLTRTQLKRMIRVESVSTAVFGAVLGLGLGLAFGLIVQRGLRSEGLESLAVPWGQLALVVIASAIAGVVAAVLPAWRAVRLDVLRAITTE
jgi:putative ABC transport system permease protein